jgi:hypothetical protein
MRAYQVAVIVGSLRRDSFKRKLALAIANSVFPPPSHLGWPAPVFKEPASAQAQLLF